MDYTLTLTQQDIQIVINALADLPFKMVANTFASIQKQVTDQDTPKE